MFSLKIFFIFLLISKCFTFKFLIPEVHPDTFLSIEELTEKYGYPLESHDVTTDDGYILTIHRIPYGKNNFGRKKKVILLTHGLFSQSNIFVMGGFLNTSLAYHLADNDYDVWLTNVRGTEYGSKHLILTSDESSFWKFSWHEIGKYDLPAIIDFVLQNTGRKKIFYLGYSQGGTVYFVLNALRPEYQNKLIHVTLFAPGYFNGNYKNSLIISLAETNNIIVTNNIGMYEILKVLPKLMKIGFETLDLIIGTPLQIIVERIFLEFVGDSNEMPKIIFPSGITSLETISSFQLVHYSQIVESGHFRQYDYGEEKNLKIYGNSTPPVYEIEHIETPITLYYSLNDKIISTQDNLILCNKLKNCNRKIQMKNSEWNHCDYVLSKNVKKEVNEVVVEDLKNYQDY